MTLAKLSSGWWDGTGIDSFPPKSSLRRIQALQRGSIVVLGGTTSKLLELARELSGKAAYKNSPRGFQAPVLIVDEASMMVFPHFLALSTLVQEDGEIMLAGDHRQLAPIVAHDWDREDRPPAVLYQPFASSYQAVQSISKKPRVTQRSVRCGHLHFTFRLPPPIRELIARLYRRDQIILRGREREWAGGVPGEQGSWDRVWRGETGLYLVTHSEVESKQSNPLEARIVSEILSRMQPREERSTGIITPHRAQRALLKTSLVDQRQYADVIDTVEKLQGNERKNIIVSATASDPSAISANVQFILDLNRANVAFSRAQDRLIVVCSESLLNYIPPELDHYDSAMLWKSLRALCSEQVAGFQFEGHHVNILTPSAAAIAQ